MSDENKPPESINTAEAVSVNTESDASTADAEKNAVAESENAAAAIPSNPIEGPSSQPIAEQSKANTLQVSNDTTSVQEEDFSSEAEDFLDQLGLSDGDDLTEEDIEKFLSLKDPEFIEKMKVIESDKELSLSQIEVDDETAALHDEIDRWRNSKGIKKLLYIFFPFLPRLNLMQLRMRARLFAWFRMMRIRIVTKLKYVATEGRKNLVKNSKEVFAKIGKSLKKSIGGFKALSLKLKLAFLAFIVLCISGGFLIWATWTGYFFKLGDEELFLKSLDSIAINSIVIESDSEYENFYDNSRSTPNLLLIQKIVVNIRPTAQSGKNPMFATEFFVEGLTPDVLIEVKDREAFFRDLVQRTTEEFNFDQLSSVEGRKVLVNALLREMNRNLTTGELRNIRFKTIVVKP